MSFVIKLNNGYVRWSHIGGYTVVINSELATRYSNKASAMIGRPWHKTNIGDFQIGEVVPTDGGVKSWESPLHPSFLLKSVCFCVRLLTG